MLRDGISEMLLSFGRYWMQHGTDLLKVSKQMNVNIYFCYFDTQKEWKKNESTKSISISLPLFMWCKIFMIVCVWVCEINGSILHLFYSI